LNNFTKNRYIAYISGKPLERILTHISKFLRDFIVYFYDAISSSSEKCKTLQWFFGPLYDRNLLTLGGQNLSNLHNFFRVYWVTP